MMVEIFWRLRKIKWRAIGLAIIFLALFVLLILLILVGYQLHWTGFNEYIDTSGIYHPAKNLWDWMELLFIPLVLAIGLFLLNRAERRVELEIAQRQSYDSTLEKYYERISKMLLEDELQTSNKSLAQQVARAQTLAALRSLDGIRKGFLIQFLHDAKLIAKTDTLINLHHADLRSAQIAALVTDQTGPAVRPADLSKVNLSRTEMNRANLRFANLSEAELLITRLNQADLSYANLSQANLEGTTLWRTDLRKANMKGANLKNTQLFGADLTGADLRGVDLEGAAFTPKGHPYWKYLGDAVLKSADLRGANLQGAIVTTKQLSQVSSLEGAILPDGTKYGIKSSQIST